MLCYSRVFYVILWYLEVEPLVEVDAGGGRDGAPRGALAQDGTGAAGDRGKGGAIGVVGLGQSRVFEQYTYR